MRDPEYYEALLQRIADLRRELTALSYREATSFAYVVSREMPEEAARMLIAEMLMEYWRQTHSAARR